VTGRLQRSFLAHPSRLPVRLRSSIDREQIVEDRDSVAVRIHFPTQVIPQVMSLVVLK
jgi:hypothetical protein